ncbi:hypothetical protein QOZ80_5AG0384670 [Eleusine coracana subsp. coracana]|nr:hypothetical protein QOZ80_5AG0384670 [Eleusine coracana subsp. coracana]
MEQTYGACISDLESKLEQQAKHILNLQETNKELEDTKGRLCTEVTVQQEEKTALLAKLQQVEASLKNLGGQLDQQLKKTSQMEQTYGAFIIDLESKLEQQAKHISNHHETNRNMETTKNDLNNRVIIQQQEKRAALAKLQQVEASMKNLEAQLQQQLKKTSQIEQTYGAFISDLEGKLEQKGKYISSLQDTNTELKARKIDLNHHIKVQQEEKFVALAKVQQVEASLKDLEGQLEQQLKKTSHMEQTYGAFISDLESKLEQQAKHISNLQETNKEMEDTKGRLYNEVTVQQEENTALLAKLQQVEASLKNLEGQLDQQLKKTSQMEQTYGAFISDLESKLEQQAKHISNHQETNRNLEATKNDLNNRVIVQQEEKSAALAKLQQVEASMKNLEAQLQQQLKKTSQIEQTYGAFISDLEDKLEQKDKYISSIQETKTELEAKYISYEEKISCMQKKNEDLDLAYSNLQNKIMELRGEKSEALASIVNLKSKLEEQALHISYVQDTNKDLESVKYNLYNESMVHQEEKSAALAQLEQVKGAMKNLENQLEEQLEKFSHMEKTHKCFIADLNIKLQQQATHITNLQETNRDLEVSKIGLYNKVTVYQEDKITAIAKLQQVEASVKNLEGQLQQKLETILHLQKINKALELANSNLQNEITEMQGENNAALVSIVDLKSKFQEQARHISNLQETNKDLEARVTDMSQENMKLHTNVKDLEVQLQLVKEKLKVAEVENKWKEDRYATTVETLQAEIQNLEQLVSVLEETLDDVKGHAETGIFSLAEKLDELELSLSQGLTRFVYRSSTSSEELKVLRKKLQDHFDEQKELLKKNDKLAKRFRDNEKVLSEMVKNDAKAGIIEKKVEDKESRAERTNYMTIFSRRWPILRRKWRRNSYSVG